MRLALLALCLGIRAANAAAAVPEPAGFWAGPSLGETPATIRDGKVVHTAELAALVGESHVLLLDVSPVPVRPDHLAAGAVWLPVRHRDIAGSRWLPGAGAATLTPGFDQFLRLTLRRLSEGDVHAAIAVYCHPRCWLSWNAAKRMILYGYRTVYWYPDGVEGWAGAGHATEEARPLTPGGDPVSRH